jgi:hypothetical protein
MNMLPRTDTERKVSAGVDSQSLDEYLQAIKPTINDLAAFARKATEEQLRRIDDSLGEPIGAIYSLLDLPERGDSTTINAEGDSENDPRLVGFEDFRRLMPNWVNEEQARQRWIAESISAHLPEFFDGLKRWLASVTWATDSGRFICSPANFIIDRSKNPPRRRWREHPQPSGKPPIVSERENARLSAEARRQEVAEWEATWRPRAERGDKLPENIAEDLATLDIRRIMTANGRIPNEGQIRKARAEAARWQAKLPKEVLEAIAGAGQDLPEMPPTPTSREIRELLLRVENSSKKDA